MADQSPPTKAALAEAARKARRAAQEAEALRANLHRRKAQARAAAGRNPAPPTLAARRGEPPCR